MKQIKVLKLKIEQNSSTTKKEYNFVKLVFSNMSAFNKVKNLWYKGKDWKKRKEKEGKEEKDNLRKI